MLRTAGGTVVRDVASAGTPVAFQIDQYDVETSSGWSVLVNGTIHDVTGADDRRRVIEAGLRPWASGSREHFLRIVPSWVSGRRIGVGVVSPSAGPDADQRIDLTTGERESAPGPG